MKILVGKVLKHLRYENNLSQQSAAELLFISRQTYKKWESDCNEICQTKLFLIAKVYNISINYLINLIAIENKIDLKTNNDEPIAIHEKFQDIKNDLVLIKSIMQNLNT